MALSSVLLASVTHPMAEQQVFDLFSRQREDEIWNELVVRFDALQANLFESRVNPLILECKPIFQFKCLDAEARQQSANEVFLSLFGCRNLNFAVRLTVFA